MSWISATQDAAAPPTASTTSPWLVDEFVESYVQWRSAAAAVKDAYEHWTGAKHGQRALAFAVYRAALDGEELAARAHCDCAERIAGRPR
jgi:hypothetical protein